MWLWLWWFPGAAAFLVGIWVAAPTARTFLSPGWGPVRRNDETVFQAQQAQR
jgi:hypothetical protein